jgi:hypothetical protein
MVQWIDCVRSQGIDSLQVIDAAGSDPDTLKAYRGHTFAFYKLLPASGGAGNTNTGAGFRLLNPGTQTVRTAYAGYATTIDSTSNSGGLTWGVDTTALPRDTLVQATGMSIQQSGGQITIQSKALAIPNRTLLRSISGDTTYIYLINKSGSFLYYRFDPDDSTTPDDSATCFVNGTGDRFKLYHESYVPAIAFDIDPTGVIDCSYEIQKAINYTIRNSRSSTLLFPSGLFLVKNLLIYKDEDSDGEYEFVTMTIEGATAVHDVSTTPGATTIFYTNDGTAFTLGVQKGRNVSIKNISFLGSSPISGDYKNTIEWTDTDWTTGVRNNRYSPHAGIVIDPLHADVTSLNRYPGMTDYYTNNSAGGTSEVLIEGCHIRQYVVGVMVSPSAHTQNCDNIVFRDGSAYANRSFWASGQNQSRANQIVNLYSLGQTKYVTNCAEYGSQQGTPPNMTGCNIAGSHKYIYEINGLFSGMQITDCYFESLYSLGRTAASSLPVIFRGCQIILDRPDVSETFASPVIAEGSEVDFIGGSLERFDNENAGAFQFNLYLLKFAGTTIAGGVPTNQASRKGIMHFDNVYFINGLGSSYLWESQHIFSGDLGDYKNKFIIPGMVLRLNNDVDFQSIDNKLDYIFTESKTINIDTTAHTAYFLATTPAKYQVRDLLTVSNSVDDATDIYSTSTTSIGWVYAISGDTIKLKYVPYGADESTTYNISITRIPKLICRTLGDVTSGSSTITNVNYQLYTFDVGSRIKGTGIPDGAVVTAVSGTNITISENATATNTNVELYDAKVKATVHSRFPTVLSGAAFFRGDIIYNTYELGSVTDTTIAWVCKRAGINGTANLPIFQEIKGNPVLEATLNTALALKANLASPTFTGTPAAPTASNGTNTTQIATTAFVQNAVSTFSSGTYTPTVTTVTNVSGSPTVSVCQYQRVGNVVTVSGRIQITATAGSTNTELQLTLPIASDFADSGEAGGTASGWDTSTSCAIFADTSSDIVTLKFVAPNTSAQYYSFHFTYKVTAP